MMIFFTDCSETEVVMVAEIVLLKNIVMSKRKKAIDDFFSSYERHFNDAMAESTPDVTDSIKSSFANCFVESSPQGVNCGKNDDEFVARINQGFEFYRNIGSKGMNIISKEVSMLDDLHAMAKVYWRYSYSKEDKPGIIDFHVIYLLTMANEPKIFAYIAGDEQKALKEKGLISEEQMVHNE
jgi:hypothetical protein